MRKERTLILLGACGGIAKSILKLVTQEGYDILAVDISSSIEEIASVNIKTVCGDIKSEKVLAEVDKILREMPPLYGVISTVGIMIPGSLTEISEADFEKTININFTSVVRFLKYVIPKLIQNKNGRIILLASVLGVVGSYNLTAYSVSKAAIIELVKCLALDYGDKGILSNCISPGFVKTQMLEDAMSSLSKNKHWMFAVGGLPKQFVNSSDIATAVLFLLNQSSINGENLIIDAAYSSR